MLMTRSTAVLAVAGAIAPVMGGLVLFSGPQPWKRPKPQPSQTQATQVLLPRIETHGY
jgi:hypothetical protein